jgi:N-methylhydantoinase A
MFLAPAHEVDLDRLHAAFAELEAEGRERLRAEGVSEDRVVLRRSIAMRYLGQWRSMNVELDPGPIDIDTLVERFHSEHEREFSYRRNEAAVELYRLELAAIGQTDDVRLPRAEPSPDGALPAPASVRDVWFDGAEQPVDTPIYVRDALPVGVRFTGPAVVDQLDTTTLIPPGVEAEIDENLNIRMHIPSEG